MVFVLSGAQGGGEIRIPSLPLTWRSVPRFPFWILPVPARFFRLCTLDALGDHKHIIRSCHLLLVFLRKRTPSLFSETGYGSLWSFSALSHFSPLTATSAFPFASYSYCEAEGTSTLGWYCKKRKYSAFLNRRCLPVWRKWRFGWGASCVVSWVSGLGSKTRAWD